MVEKPTWTNTIYSRNKTFSLTEASNNAFALGYKYVLFDNKLYSTSCKEIKDFTPNDLKWETIKALLE